MNALTPKIMKFPAVLTLDSMPVHEDGAFDWTGAIACGRPGSIELEPGQNLYSLACALRVIAGICEATADVGGAPNPVRLAEKIQKHLDPVRPAALEGHAFLCGRCSVLFELPEGPNAPNGFVACPWCQTVMDPLSSGFRAEQHVGVVGPWSQRKEQEALQPRPRCSVCGAPQHSTPSGLVCPSGHGGAPSLSPDQCATAAKWF